MKMNKYFRYLILVICFSLISTINVSAAACPSGSAANTVFKAGSYKISHSISKGGANSTYTFTLSASTNKDNIKTELVKIPFSYRCYDISYQDDDNDVFVHKNIYTEGDSLFLKKSSSKNGTDKYSASVSFNAPSTGYYSCKFVIPNTYVVDNCTPEDFEVEKVIEVNGSANSYKQNTCIYSKDVENLREKIVPPVDCNVEQTDDFYKEFCKAKKNAEIDNNASGDNKGKLYSTINGSFKDTLKFKCDPQKGIEGMINGSINPNNYVNVSYAYGHSTEKVSSGKYTYHYSRPDKIDKEISVSLERECQEAVTVEYGAPIASKAGLCFQYKVKVTSRVVCSVKDIPEQPDIDNGYCEPVPECIHKNSKGKTVKLRQGGPNDKFDECIKNCDGGKYTSKCSKSCYKKVYGSNSKSSIKTSLSSDSLSATKVSYPVCDPYNEDYICNSCKLNYSMNYYQKYPVENNSVYCKNGSFDVTNFKNLFNSQCHYELSNGVPMWVCPESVNTSDKSIVNNYIYGRWYAYSENSSWGIEPTCRYSVKSGDNGIPRRDHHKSAEHDRCVDECHWTLDKNSCSSNYINPGLSEYDNYNNLIVYENIVNKAVAAATCTTSTATFTIHATYYDNDQKKNVTIDFPYSPSKNPDSLSSGENTVNTSTSKNTTIIGYNGCYKSKDENKWYQAEWSFPGSYLDNKHNGLSYNPGDNDKGWEKVKAFCLPLNAGDVNISWYNWFMTKVIAGKTTSITSDKYKEKCIDKGDSKAITKITKFTDAKDLVWNILAKTRKFGYYKWNIDISCFYAINSNTSIGNINKSTHENEEECTTDAQGYSIRSVDLKNLFPASNGATLSNTNSTGRAPGFNWSKYANNTINNSKYTSNPTDYIAQVQSLGEGVYSDEYLDYKFELDRATLNKLKGHNYTDFDGDAIKRNNGIVSYYSKVITSLLESKNSKTSPRFDDDKSYAPLDKYRTQCNNLDKNGCSK